MNKRILALLSASAIVAAACAAPDPGAEDAAAESAPAQAVAADWPPTAEEEAFYNRRFEILLESFKSGEDTTTYDTLAPIGGAADPDQGLPTSEAGLDPETAAKVDAYASDNNSHAFIVYKDGEILLESYYQGWDVDTLIVGKSLAKPLGVMAVGTAIKAGKIESLDQPVSDFITEWQGTDKGAILVRHLLDMRSGLLPQAGAPNPEDVLNRAYLHPRHDEIIIRDYPLTHVPGERYEYSNANAELVAPLIERATGVQYEDWVADTLLAPLGAAGGEIWMNREGGTAHAGCCILLPARSFLKLAVLLMQDGVWNDVQLLPEGYADEMRTPTPQNPHSAMGVYVGSPYIERRGFLNPEIEIGKSFHSEPYVDEDLYLFDGNSNQVVYIMPSRELIVLRLGNRPRKDPEWDNTYLPNTIARSFDVSDD